MPKSSARRKLGRPAKLHGRPASHAQSSARAPPYSSYKYHGAPLGRKCEESRERGEVLRVGGLPSFSGVLRVARARKLYQNPFGFDGVFRALVRSSEGALSEFCEF
jgi:hypothetical protein